MMKPKMNKRQDNTTSVLPFIITDAYFNWLLRIFLV